MSGEENEVQTEIPLSLRENRNHNCRTMELKTVLIMLQPDSERQALCFLMINRPQICVCVGDHERGGRDLKEGELKTSKSRVIKLVGH